jgi:hypothetical protein
MYARASAGVSSPFGDLEAACTAGGGATAGSAAATSMGDGGADAPLGAHAVAHVHELNKPIHASRATRILHR